MTPEDVQSEILKFLLRAGGHRARSWCSVNEIREAVQAPAQLIRDLLLRLETLGSVERSASGLGWRLRD
jgi:DNA-binding IclR family transcriptional regulator